MRFRLAVLLATMAFCGVAQRGGGMPVGHGGEAGGGRWGSPLPTPGFPGIGRHPGWGGGHHGFGPAMNYGSFPSWFDTPLCASPLFPLAPNCSFGNGQGYYPPPVYVNPVVNVVPPALPLVPPPIPTASIPEDVPDTAAPAQANSLERAQADTREYQQAPVRSQEVQDKCPPLIVLKTGGMYSITRYWIKGKTLYFETTARDTLYTPVGTLDRIIPGR